MLNCVVGDLVRAGCTVFVCFAEIVLKFCDCDVFEECVLLISLCCVCEIWNLLFDLLFESLVEVWALVAEDVVIMCCECICNLLRCGVCVVVDFECGSEMLFWMRELFECWPELVVPWALLNDL